MAGTFRIERVNHTIQRVISEQLLTGVKDPRVGLVSITAVRVSRDLAVARVYWSILGDEEARERSRRGLVSARNYLRRAIGRELRIHNAPELRFIYDDSIDRSIRIEQALREAGVEPAEAVDGGGAPERDDAGAPATTGSGGSAADGTSPDDGEDAR